METENAKVVNENILEIQVEAHLQGHDRHLLSCVKMRRGMRPGASGVAGRSGWVGRA